MHSNLRIKSVLSVPASIAALQYYIYIANSVSLTNIINYRCSVKNFHSDKLYKLGYFVKQVYKDAGCELTKTVKTTGSSRRGGKRIRETGENTFCFSRKETV
jgi:hypothetical protein